ncbi:sulfurtransferase [Cesiribacter sp. SM1]|uniref:sulfurtransferase n=1 Tax=Cesiribacter sp. SM1 TaxID=2861196 RepID=UPI001CD241CD|nr:sulfurtransferase [Cesiribacter sp. SM1]
MKGTYHSSAMVKKGLSPIVGANELLALHQQQDFILIDVSNSHDAFTNYQNRHLKGALFVDLNAQLADIKDDFSKGGRHPLPTTEQFSRTLSSLGITKNSHVVVYDDKSAANSAARFWWMLKAAGHEWVQVLNGGLQAAQKAGYPLEKDINQPQQAEPYKIEKWQLPLADMAEVASAATDGKSIVIDVRDSERYNGIVEPVDLVAGHIPGAINIPFKLNLDSNGLFLPPEALQKIYQESFNRAQPANMIVHCGSGVTACHTLLAMAYAGFELPKLYVGSWSEWSRNNQPIAAQKL